MVSRRLAHLFVSLSVTLVTVSAQVPAWGQCGGSSWSGQGASVCSVGYNCVDISPYYSQCQPQSAGSAPNALVHPAASLPGTPSTTASAAAATGSQIRTVQSPVYHLYLQNNGGKPVLGPEASAGRFTISGSISLNNDDGSKLYLNLDSAATTSYKPLLFNTTATTTNWGLEGDTIITTNPRQLNFIACSTSNSNFYDLFLQNGNDTPSGRSCSLQTIHLPCLC